MKKLLLILLIVGIFCFNAEATPDLDVHLQNYYLLQESAVSLLIIRDDKVFSCSGIIITEDQNSVGILTAGHCFKGNTTRIIVNEEYVSTTFEIADNVDIGYVELNHSLLRYNPVKIAKANARKGDLVYYLGYPKLAEKYEVGIVTWYEIKNQYMYMVSTKGCSGAGIVNKKGYLVGILWGGTNGTIYGVQAGIVVMTPIERIKPFLVKIGVWDKIK